LESEYEGEDNATQVSKGTDEARHDSLENEINDQVNELVSVSRYGECTYIIVRVTVRHKGEIGTIPELGEYRGDGKDAHQDGYCCKNQ
jgi:hypothetical protein